MLRNYYTVKIRFSEKEKILGNKTDVEKPVDIMKIELRCPRCLRKFDVSRCSNCGNRMKLATDRGKPSYVECVRDNNHFGIKCCPHCLRFYIETQVQVSKSYVGSEIHYNPKFKCAKCKHKWTEDRCEKRHCNLKVIKLSGDAILECQADNCDEVYSEISCPRCGEVSSIGNAHNSWL